MICQARFLSERKSNVDAEVCISSRSDGDAANGGVDMADSARIRTEDVLPVMSRISWGAILGGAFTSLAVYTLLSVLGIAIGLSAANDLRGDTIATGAGIYALVSLLLALAAGGCVATMCTAGENKMEAVIYGVILWGVMFVMTLWVSGNVIRTGLNMVVGSANAAATATQGNVNWERVAQNANLSQQQIEQIRNEMPTGDQARSIGAEAAWWSLAGVIVSMAAAIGGALMGAGPGLRLRGVLVQSSDHRISGGMPSPSH